MIAENNESMKSFTFSLKQLTEDEKIQMQCEARRRYECDRASLHHQGFRESVEREKQNTLREQERAHMAEERAIAEKQRADAIEEELYRLKSQLSK